MLPDQQYPAGQYQTHHYPPYFPLFSSLAPQYCCNTSSMMEMAQPSSLPPSGHPLPLSARQLHAREEGGRRRREERRELRSVEGSSISIREEQTRTEERKRRGGEEGREMEVSKRGEGAPPVSAFHVPPKTAPCQGAKELRGECEGGEERAELECERGGSLKQGVEKVQGVQVQKVAPERGRRKEEEEEEEAVIEQELGSIVHDMQISAWTEGTHI